MRHANCILELCAMQILRLGYLSQIKTLSRLLNCAFCFQLERFSIVCTHHVRSLYCSPSGDVGCRTSKNEIRIWYQIDSPFVLVPFCFICFTVFKELYFRVPSQCLYIDQLQLFAVTIESINRCR